MINKIQTKIYFFSLSIFIVLIDQYTKYLMFYNKKLFINKDFLLFKLDFVKNYGAAFNIFSGSRVFLSLISIFFSLLLIYFFGISVSGAQRWLNFGIFSFQPSEVAKLSTVLTLALVLDKKIILTIRDLVSPFLVVVIPWLLIFFQPDLGTSLVLLVLTSVMLYWSQMPIEWILILVFCIITSILYLTLQTLRIFWIPVIGYLAY